jgi:hypothetical protein
VNSDIENKVKANKLKKKDDYDWKIYVQDELLTGREKFEMVKMKAKHLEENAKLDEKLLMIDTDDSVQVEKAIEVNDLYIKSIQAKLSLLDSS